MRWIVESNCFQVTLYFFICVAVLALPTQAAVEMRLDGRPATLGTNLQAQAIPDLLLVEQNAGDLVRAYGRELTIQPAALVFFDLESLPKVEVRNAAGELMPADFVGTPTLDDFAPTIDYLPPDASHPNCGIKPGYPLKRSRQLRIKLGSSWDDRSAYTIRLKGLRLAAHPDRVHGFANLQLLGQGATATVANVGILDHFGWFERPVVDDPRRVVISGLKLTYSAYTGRPVLIFIAAVLADGRVLLMDQHQQWHPLDLSHPPAYLVGRLCWQAISLFSSPVDLTQFPGASLYAGIVPGTPLTKAMQRSYFHDMVYNGMYDWIYTVPD